MKKLLFLLLKSTFLTILVSISGCSHLANSPKSVDDELKLKTEKKTVRTKLSEQPAKPTNMTAEMMYKVLLAEMLVKKQRPKTAFQVLYPLAVETRDKGLAKRVFHLSMKTLDVSAIDAATTLWMEVSPKEDLPWKAAYLLDVRLGHVDAGLKKWQTYLSLTDKTLEEVFVETSLRVAKSAPRLSGLSFLKKINEAYPTEPAAIFGFGSAAEEYREFKLAIPKLIESIERYDNLEASQLTAVSKEIKKEAYYSLANSYLRSKQYRHGINVISPHLSEVPTDWRLQELLARLEVKAGMLEEAENRYQLVVDNEPSAYSARLALGLLLLERSEYAKAKKHLLILKKNRPYFSIATYYLGVSEQNQAFFADAVNYFSQIKTRDYYIDAQLRMLEINFSKNGLTKTIQTINRLEVNSDQDKLKLYHAKAVFFGYEGKQLQAVNAYQEGLDIYPNNVNMLILQSQELYGLKQFVRYETNLLRVLELEPQNVEALNGLGYHYVEQGKKLAQAEIMLETANRLDPNSFYIIDSLGWLAFQKNEFDKSEALLEKAFLLREDLEVLLHLMQVKSQLDKNQEAVALGEKYKRYFKNDAKLVKLLKQLQK